MKTYYVVALMQLPGFHGKLPYLYSATYKSKEKAAEAMQYLQESYPAAKYTVVPIDLPVHPEDNLTDKEQA